MTRAHWTAIVLLILAFVFLWFSVKLAIATMAVYIVLFLAAPYFPRWQFFLPITTHGSRDSKQVALTFDDGPDETTTPVLLKLLDKYSIKAAFFVVGWKAEKLPDLTHDILSQGHSIGNHTYTHHPLFALMNSTRMRDDIQKCQSVLARYEVKTPFFRPVAGVTSPPLKKALQSLEMVCIAFSCRGNDWGNRRIKGLSRRILKKVKPGDIVLLHDCVGGRRFDLDQWLKEVETLIEGLESRGLEIVQFEDLISDI